MTRRFFALFAVSVLSICLTLRAQPPAKSSKADAKPAEASPTKIVVDQDAVLREYKQFEDLLLRLAQRIECASSSSVVASM